MSAVLLPALTGDPARLLIAVAVGSAVVMAAAPGARPPARPMGEGHRRSTSSKGALLALGRLAVGRRAAADPATTRGRSVRASRRPAMRRRTGPTRPEAVAAWCDELARRCRSGSTLAEALAGSSPSTPELRRVVDDVSTSVERGSSLRAALDAVDRPSDPAVHLAVRVMAACARVGGPIARPLDRAAATLRLRHADELDRAAQSAQARMSAQVLTAVPVGALALLATLDPEVRAVISSPLGLALVAAGSTASALGWWWMRRIVRGARW